MTSSTTFSLIGLMDRVGHDHQSKWGESYVPFATVSRVCKIESRRYSIRSTCEAVIKRPFSVHKTGVKSGETRPRSTCRPVRNLLVRLGRQQVYRSLTCQRSPQQHDGSHALPAHGSWGFLGAKCCRHC